MTINATQSPINFFADKDGSPLDAGYLFFGVSGSNPETSPITVYWDAAGTQPAAQPIRTLNGVPARAGTPAAIYVGSDYSCTVKNKKGALVQTYAGVSVPAVSAFMSTVVTATDAATARAALGAASASGTSPRATRIDVASVAGVVDLTTNAPNTDDIRLTGALAITGFTVATDRVIRVTAGGAFTLVNGSGLITQTGADIVANAGDTLMLRAIAANVVEVLGFTRAASSATGSMAMNVRQTVLSGPVDANGLPNFGGGTGATTVTATGTLIAAAANGFTNKGAQDYIGSITNPQWTGLSTNGTMYLGLTISSNGTCTPFVTSLAPIYQWGGSAGVATGQRTFNIQSMQMQTGNGSAASQAYDVFVGEVTVAAGVVSAITWYALMARYIGAWTTPLPNAAVAVSANHNIGTSDINPKLEIKNLTAEFGFSVGEIITEPYGNTGGVGAPLTLSRTTKTVGFTGASTVGVVAPNKTTGSTANLTVGNWAYRFIAQRSW
jgi:hypothetical protein